MNGWRIIAGAIWTRGLRGRKYSYCESTTTVHLSDLFRYVEPTRLWHPASLYLLHPCSRRQLLLRCSTSCVPAVVRKHHRGPFFRSFSLRRTHSAPASCVALPPASLQSYAPRSENCPGCGTFSLRIFLPRRLPKKRAGEINPGSPKVTTKIGGLPPDQPGPRCRPLKAGWSRRFVSYWQSGESCRWCSQSPGFPGRLIGRPRFSLMCDR